MDDQEFDHVFDFLPPIVDAGQRVEVLDLARVDIGKDERPVASICIAREDDQALGHEVHPLGPFFHGLCCGTSNAKQFHEEGGEDVHTREVLE